MPLARTTVGWSSFAPWTGGCCPPVTCRWRTSRWLRRWPLSPWQWVQPRCSSPAVARPGTHRRTVPSTASGQPRRRPTFRWCSTSAAPATSSIATTSTTVYLSRPTSMVVPRTSVPLTTWRSRFHQCKPWPPWFSMACSIASPIYALASSNRAQSGCPVGCGRWRARSRRSASMRNECGHCTCGPVITCVGR